jgi:hypothetical protein
MSNSVKITRNTLTVQKKLQLIKDSEVYNKKNVDLAKKYKVSKACVSETIKNGTEIKKKVIQVHKKVKRVRKIMFQSMGSC